MHGISDHRAALAGTQPLAVHDAQALQTAGEGRQQELAQLHPRLREPQAMQVDLGLDAVLAAAQPAQHGLGHAGLAVLQSSRRVGCRDRRPAAPGSRAAPRSRSARVWRARGGGLRGAGWRAGASPAVAPRAWRRGKCRVHRPCRPSRIPPEAGFQYIGAPSVTGLAAQRNENPGQQRRRLSSRGHRAAARGARRRWPTSPWSRPTATGAGRAIR